MKNFLLAIATLSLLSACGKESEPAAPVIDIDAGRLVAEAECSGCHGMDGRGDTSKIPNLAGQTALYLGNAMHAYRDGERQHAALQDLISEMSEADINNIAAFYGSLPPLANLEPPDSSSYFSKGASIAAICEECHGERGISDTEGMPSLAGQQPAYLLMATLEYQKGERGHGESEEMLAELPEVDIEKMAMYFAFQTPEVREAPPFGNPKAGEPLTADCGECHGARGVSYEPLVPSLAGQEPNYLVSSIKAYRDHDRSHDEMNADLSDEQIEHIAAFYAVQSAESAGGADGNLEQLVAKCDRCHDPISATRKMTIPAIKGQSRDYLVKAMQAYRKDNRASSMMHKMSARYSDEVIEAMANYYAAQSN
jgi:cytochrome c553